MKTHSQTFTEKPDDHIQEKIERYEKTLSILRCSDVKEIRLMFGTVDFKTVSNEIFPIAEFKRTYMQAIKARIIELKYELMKNNLKTVTD